MKGSISISKVFGVREDDKIVRIRVTDDASCIEFAAIEITTEDFAQAILGLSHVPVEFTLRSPDLVGRLRITERRQVECPLGTIDKGELEKWLVENCQEDGWILSARLGSQESISYLGNGHRLLRYSVTKFVDQENGGAA